VRQQYHPLAGWWGAIGGRRRPQCAQGLVLSQAYLARGDTQGCVKVS
jgi:hypothetical protein